MEDQAVEAGFVDHNHFLPSSREVDSIDLTPFVGIENRREIFRSRSQRITNILGHEPGLTVLGGHSHVSAGHRESEVGDGGGPECCL